MCILCRTVGFLKYLIGNFHIYNWINLLPYLYLQEGRTALMLASLNDQPNLVRLLHTAGANVDLRNNVSTFTYT